MVRTLPTGTNTRQLALSREGSNSRFEDQSLACFHYTTGERHGMRSSRQLNYTAEAAPACQRWISFHAAHTGLEPVSTARQAVVVTRTPMSHERRAASLTEMSAYPAVSRPGIEPGLVQGKNLVHHQLCVRPIAREASMLRPHRPA